MATLKTVVVGASLALLAGAAAAKSRRLELGGFAGGHVFSKSSELGSFDNDAVGTAPKNAALFGMRFSFETIPNLWLEGELAIMPTKTRVCCADVDVMAARVNALYEFAAGRTRAFVLLGYGIMAASSSNETLLAEDIDPVGHLGVGAKFDVYHSWGVRLDGRLLVPPSNKSGGVTPELEGMLGVYGRFGGQEPAPAVVAVPQPDPEAERIAAEQKKLEEAAAAEKQRQEEEAAALAKANADDDSDGIRNGDDKCPDQAGIPENSGCPDQDKDADGLVDRLDKCPDQAEARNGYQDADGCPDDLPGDLKAVVGALDVKFKKGASKLDKKAMAALDKVAAALAATPEVNVVVVAKVAPTAKPDKDAVLAAARAQAVVAYLTSKGVAATRVAARADVGTADEMTLEVVVAPGPVGAPQEPPPTTVG